MRARAAITIRFVTGQECGGRTVSVCDDAVTCSRSPRCRTLWRSKCTIKKLRRTDGKSHARTQYRTLHGLLTRRTNTPVSPGGISRLFPSQIRGGGSVLSIFRLSRGSSEGLWPSFVGRKATELSSGRALIRRGSYFLISLTSLSESNYYKVDRVGGRSY